VTDPKTEKFPIAIIINPNPSAAIRRIFIFK
jgi:hypothetical protein